MTYYLACHPKRAQFSLYRSLLRETGRLPHYYLRLFFKIKFRDDFRSGINFNSRQPELSPSKMKRLSTELRKLRKANVGDKKAFEHILDIAYGRKGKFKWELLEPFLTDPHAPKPPMMIANEERSRPPVYSPGLTALLTSPHSRTTKPLKQGSLLKPPTLPPRGDHSSEEARLLGPLSRRRHVNILWRYFAAEKRKTLPPLQISVQEVSRTTGASEPSSSKRVLEKIGLKGTGLQATGVMEDIQNLIGPDRGIQTLIRKRLSVNDRTEAGKTTEPILETARCPLPTRYLRRRHQELLGRLPMLVYSVLKPEIEVEGDVPGRTEGKFEVSFAPKTIAPSIRYSGRRLAEVDELNMAWIKLADDAHDGKGSPSK